MALGSSVNCFASAFGASSHSFPPARWAGGSESGIFQNHGKFRNQIWTVRGPSLTYSSSVRSSGACTTDGPPLHNEFRAFQRRRSFSGWALLATWQLWQWVDGAATSSRATVRDSRLLLNWRQTRTRSDDLLGNQLVPSFTPLVWQYLCLHQKTLAALWSSRHPDAKLPPLAQPGNLSRLVQELLELNYSMTQQVLGVQIPSKTSKNFCNDPFQNASSESSGNVEKLLPTFSVICSFRSSKSLRWGRSSAPFRPWRVGSWVSLQVSQASKVPCSSGTKNGDAKMKG